MKRKSIKLVTLFLVLSLLGCQSETRSDEGTNKLNEQEKNSSNDNGINDLEVDDFPITFSEINLIHTEEYLSVTKEKDSYLMMLYDISGYIWLDDNNEGAIIWSPQEKELSISIIAGVTSCTGSQDGHKLNTLLNIDSLEIIDKEIVVWTGCDGELNDLEFEVSDEQIVQFAKDAYMTIKNWEENIPKDINSPEDLGIDTSKYFLLEFENGSVIEQDFIDEISWGGPPYRNEIEYVIRVKNYDWMGGILEGSVVFSADKSEIMFGLPLIESRCQKGINGFVLNVTVDLNTLEVMDKKIEETVSCEEQISDFKDRVTDEDFIQLAIDLYTTLKHDQVGK